MTTHEPNVAQLLVECLENAGVEYVFGVPGEENVHIMDALRDFLDTVYPGPLRAMRRRLWPTFTGVLPGKLAYVWLPSAQAPSACCSVSPTRSSIAARW
jgi:Thiamine pyrophosphate enzyme, N-terminal TPP binding domain